MLITFGSPRTSNVVVDTHPEINSYQGVDELTGMGQPTVATLDLIKALRAVREDEGGHNPDRELPYLHDRPKIRPLTPPMSWMLST